MASGFCEVMIVSVPMGKLRVRQIALEPARPSNFSIGGRSPTISKEQLSSEREQFVIPNAVRDLRLLLSSFQVGGKPGPITSQPLRG